MPFRPRDMAELMRLAIPVVVTRLGVMAMGVIDTVVVGRYSTAELGYMALGLAPTGVAVMTALGLLSGVQVMTARLSGAGLDDQTGAVLRRGIVYAAGLGLLFTALMMAGGPALLRLSGVEPDLAAGGGRTLLVFAASLTPSLMGIACSSWLEAKGRPIEAMVVMWLANGFNLAFDLVLVPGGLGFPALGAVGSAWATFAARWVLLAGLLACVMRTPEGRRGLMRKPPRDRDAEAAQRRIGYGAGVAFFAETAAFSGMNIIGGWVGGAAVAGWAIVLNVTSVVFMLPLGLAVAGSVLVGRAYGAGDWPGVGRAGRVGQGAAIAAAVACALVVWPLAEQITGGYTRDRALVALTAPALVLATLFFVADALQVVSSQMLRACGDIWVSTGIQIAAYAVVMLPLGYLLALPLGLGLNGMVWATTVASFLSAGLLVARFARLARPHGLG